MVNRLLTIFSAAILLYFNLEFWHFAWLGWIILPLYFWFASDGFEKMLIKFFRFVPNARTKLYGALVSFVLIGWISGGIIVLYKLTAAAIALLLMFVGLVSTLMEEWAMKAKNSEEKPVAAEEAIIEVPQNNLYFVAYLIFVVFGLYILWHGRIGIEVLTPWQAISGNYIYLFFLAALTLGGLLFSKFKTKSLLFLLILQSFLLFAYLPLTHSTIYGADGWRHIASMRQIATEQISAPENFAENPTLIEKINPGRFSYSQFWGSMVIFSRVLQIELLPLIAWFQPVFAAFFLPLLLYELGSAMGWGKRKPLIFAWLGSFPFALQMVGAFSLPVGFGFILFLLMLLLFLKRGESRRSEQVFIFIAIGILSLFGYALYLLLFWLAWAIFEIVPRARTVKSAMRRNIIYAAMIIGSIIFIPVIELASGYASFGWGSSLWSAIKQFVGNVSGYFLASGPRSHAIDTGNIFFNQTPSYAFVPNGFTDWRWWIIILMTLAIIGMIAGLKKFWACGSSNGRFIFIFSIGVYSGYFISRYLVEGEHIISRRLEAVLALFGIILLFKAIENVFVKNQFASMLIVLIGASSIAASYSLGPTATAVSLKSFNAASAVWEKVKQEERFCVVSDTYTLLALEAISGKKIIGGGFPIDKNFGQPELTKLYDEFQTDPSKELWQKAREATNARQCFLIIKGEILNENY